MLSDDEKRDRDAAYKTAIGSNPIGDFYLSHIPINTPYIFRIYYDIRPVSGIFFIQLSNK